MLNIQKRMTKGFYALLSLPATAMGFALSVQISALSWILFNKYGLDIHEVGIVWAAGPIAGIIAQPLVGLISDKLWFMGGRRRPWIIVGGTLAALMMLALPNLEVVQHLFYGPEATGGLLGVAVIVALTLDLSINVSFNPTRSLVADCTTKENRSTGFTWMQTISGSFGVLAYLLGGVFGNYVLLYVGVIIALLTTIIPAFLIEEPRVLNVDKNDQGQEKSKSSLKDTVDSLIPLFGFLVYGIFVMIENLAGFTLPTVATIHGIHLNVVEMSCVFLELLGLAAVILNWSKSSTDSNQFQRILFAHSFTWIGVQSMFIYAFFYISQSMSGDFEPGKVNSIAFFILSLVSAILPVLVLNVYSKKIGMVKTHTICIFIMAIGYAAIFLLPLNVYVYYFLMAVCGIGWASVVSLPFAIMSEKVDQTKMGLYMGIFNLSVVLPQLVASFKMGEVVHDASNKGLVFAICALCLLVSGLLWTLVKNDKQPKGDQVQL